MECQRIFMVDGKSSEVFRCDEVFFLLFRYRHYFQRSLIFYPKMASFPQNVNDHWYSVIFGTGGGTRTHKTNILSVVRIPIPSHPH